MLRILNQQRQWKISISFVWRIIFKREQTKKVHWLPLKLSLLSERMKMTHNTEKFAIHEIRCLFCLFFSKEIPFPLLAKKKQSEKKNTHKIWIKSLHDGEPWWKNLHTESHYWITIVHFNCLTWPNSQTIPPIYRKKRCLDGKKNCRFSLI